MIKRILKFILLLCVIPASMLLYNEVLYFTGWGENPSIPDNKAPMHFYVINLDRQPERFETFKKQADKFGINVERVSATDGYKVVFQDQETKDVFTGEDIKNKTQAFVPEHKYDVYCNSDDYEQKKSPEFVYEAFKALTRGLTAGEIGCTCSHIILWHKIAQNKDEQIAVIFEDDAVLLDNFNTNIQEFTKVLPNQWDIAYLDAEIIHLQAKKIKEIRNVNDLRWKLHFPDLIINDYFIKIHPHSETVRLHGYAINKKSADKLLSIQRIFNSLPIDVTVAVGIQKRLLTTYKAKNELVTYDEAIESELSKMGRYEFGN